MLGDLIGESKGKRIVRRILSADPLKVEVTFEDSGQMLGVPIAGTGTYTSEVRPDGSIYGEGQGLSVTQEGDAVVWSGNGLGAIGAGGAVSYRGMLYYRTPSEKLARLNNATGAFEFEVDAAGNTSGKVWEWKASQAAKGTSA